MDSEFWAKASREKRMIQAHKDVTKSGKTKIGFHDFERRMIGRDEAIQRAEYEKRKVSLR